MADTEKTARDIQKAESGGPTGPFLAKSGSVTVSPWIVTLDALNESRLPRSLRTIVPPAAHLQDPSDVDSCFDIRCQAFWSGGGVKDFKVSEVEYKQTYWTYRQLIAHQTCNGAQVGTGDLLGTGTMSMFEVCSHSWENL
jgi:fumarylacetoacetase